MRVTVLCYGKQTSYKIRKTHFSLFFPRSVPAPEDTTETTQSSPSEQHFCFIYQQFPNAYHPQNYEWLAKNEISSFLVLSLSERMTRLLSAIQTLISSSRMCFHFWTTLNPNRVLLFAKLNARLLAIARLITYVIGSVRRIALINDSDLQRWQEGGGRMCKAEII